MPSIYYCQFLGEDGWADWQGGHLMPPLPYEFVEAEGVTVTMASRDGYDWCHAYDPGEGLLTWCTWTGTGWSDWHSIAELPPPPNWEVSGEEAFFSVGSRLGSDWLYSYNVEDGSVYCSGWTGDGYGDWEGPFYVEEDPPNIDNATDVFVAGDYTSEWLISVNPDDWSVFYAEWEGESYGPWIQAPDLFVPEEWVDAGLDLDGDGRDGAFWIYATVYDDED